MPSVSSSTRRVKCSIRGSAGVVSGRSADAVAFRNGPMSDTSREKFSELIFYALIILIGYLTYLVISPFLAPLVWAAVFAIIFYRVHLELSPRIGPSGWAMAARLRRAGLILGQRGR